MKESYKKILKLWLFLYFVLTVFRIIHSFNDSLLDTVFSIGTSPLSITSLILFVYVSDRGDEEIGKLGIISIIIFGIFCILSHFSVYKLGVLSTLSFKDKICSIIYYASESCVDICEYLAIFSLLKNNNLITKYKVIAVLCIIIFSLTDLVGRIFPDIVLKVEFWKAIVFCFSYIGSLSKYAAIIFYLSDNNYVPSLFVNSNIVLNNTSQQVQQNVIPQVSNVNQQVQQSVTPQVNNVNQQVQQSITPQVNNVNQQIQQSITPQVNNTNQQVQQNVGNSENQLMEWDVPKQ